MIRTWRKLSKLRTNVPGNTITRVCFVHFLSWGLRRKLRVRSQCKHCPESWPRRWRIQHFSWTDSELMREQLLPENRDQFRDLLTVALWAWGSVSGMFCLLRVNVVAISFIIGASVFATFCPSFWHLFAQHLTSDTELMACFLRLTISFWLLT